MIPFSALPEPAALEPLPKLGPLPKPCSNYLLVFHDPGRADIYLTVWASDADDATRMALQIEDSIGCPFAFDCLRLGK